MSLAEQRERLRPSCCNRYVEETERGVDGSGSEELKCFDMDASSLPRARAKAPSQLFSSLPHHRGDISPVVHQELVIWQVVSITQAGALHGAHHEADARSFGLGGQTEV